MNRAGGAVAREVGLSLPNNLELCKLPSIECGHVRIVPWNLSELRCTAILGIGHAVPSDGRWGAEMPAAPGGAWLL